MANRKSTYHQVEEVHEVQEENYEFKPYERVPLVDTQTFNLDNLRERTRLNSFIKSISMSHNTTNTKNINPNSFLQQSIFSDFEFTRFPSSISATKKRIFS